MAATASVANKRGCCLRPCLQCRGLFVVTFARTPEAELAQARAIASAAAASGVGKVVVSAGDALGDGGRHHDLGGDSHAGDGNEHATDGSHNNHHGSDAQWRPLGIKHHVEQVRRVLVVRCGREAIPGSSCCRGVHTTNAARADVAVTRMPTAPAPAHECTQVFRGTPDLRCAFIHPAFFFESLVSKQGHARVTKTGAGERTTVHFELPLAPNVPIPMIASADVGRVAAALLADAAAHGAAFGVGAAGAVIPLAGDAVSPRQCAVAYTAAAGVSSEYTTVPEDWLEAQAEAAVAAATSEEEAAAAAERLPVARLVTAMYRWYAAGHPGHARDVVEVRKAFPHLEDVHQWMESTGVRLVHAATA